MSKIINSHIHLGGSHIIDANYTEEQLVKNMEENNVYGMMVLPIAEPKPNYREMHDRIYRFTQSMPGRIWGVADMHPRHEEEEYVNEVKRCVLELGFVALKLHPLLHAVNPASKVADKVFRVANELKIPLMVHTGLGITASPSAMLIERAMEYPDLKIVISHAGAGNAPREAIVPAKLCPNIYLEPSWCPPHHIQTMIKTIGADRVVMGSDGLTSTHMDIAGAAVMDISEEDRTKYLGLSAAKLYNLNI